MANEIFVSYANGDRDFALRLKKAFMDIKIEPWIDFYNENHTENSGLHFERGIKNADTVVFIVSYESLTDKDCRLHIETSLKHKKHIIPLFLNEEAGIIKTFEKQFPELTDTKVFNLNKLEFDETFNSVLQEINLDYFSGNEVFISHSIEDKSFVDYLNQFLKENKIFTSADYSQLPESDDLKKNNLCLIENAHTFIYVLSSNSINSAKNIEQLEIAVNENKRIIAILVNKLEQLSTELKNIDLIDFTDKSLFGDNLHKFINIYDNDLEYSKFQTILQKKNIIDWLQKGKPESSLLSGKKLEKAEEWLKMSKSKKIKPTQIQEIYINASSLKAENERYKKNEKQIVQNVALIEDEEPEKIEEQLIKESKSSPNDVKVWRELSFYYIENERYNDAIAVSLRALEIENDFDAILNLGVAYYATSKIKSSLIEFKKAMDWVKDIEDIEEIRKALAQAYEINPDSNAVENLYDELDEMERDF